MIAFDEVCPVVGCHSAALDPHRELGDGSRDREVHPAVSAGGGCLSSYGICRRFIEKREEIKGKWMGSSLARCPEALREWRWWLPPV